MPSSSSPEEPREGCTAEIKATYTSPHSSPLKLTASFSLRPSAESVSVSDKMAYLSSLRHATTDLQERINAELTARMEDDKVRDAAAAKETRGDNVTGEVHTSKNKKGTKGRLNIDDSKREFSVDEDAEEENYGEEVIVED